MAVTQFDDLVQVGTVGSTGAVNAIAGTIGRVPCILARPVAASTTITNTTVETAFSNGVVTIPANACAAGTVFKVFAQGIAPATNGTDTLVVRLRFGAAGVGATIVAVTPTVDVANDDIWTIDARVTVRTIGGTGTFVGAGHAALGAAGTATVRGRSVGSSALDTTAARNLTVTAQWSVANANNQVRLDILHCEALW